MKNLIMPEGYFVKMKMEEEDRQLKLQKIIQYIRDYPQEEISWRDFQRICDLKGINTSTLTRHELEYIQQEIFDSAKNL